MFIDDLQNYTEGKSSAEFKAEFFVQLDSKKI